MKLKEWILRKVVKHEVKRLIRKLKTPQVETMMKNWKTTVLGWLAAIVGVSTVGWFKPDGTPNWMVIVLGLLVGLLGTIAKDHDVTGGTVKQG